jgi:hypothetical protein
VGNTKYFIRRWFIMANQNSTSKKHKRRYIRLGEDGTGAEVCPDEFFQEEVCDLYTDHDDYYCEDDMEGLKELREKADEKIDRFISEFGFIALVIAVILAVAGLFVLLFRALSYPFVKLFSDDCDF